MMTSSTELLFAGEGAREIVALSFPDAEVGDGAVLLPGVVSRKKQMVPNLTHGITDWQANQ